MNYLTDNAFTAYVGIDWADSKHDICVATGAFMMHRPFGRGDSKGGLAVSTRLRQVHPINSMHSL